MQPRQPVVEVMDAQMVEVLRNKTPQERMQMAMGMWKSARVLIRGAVSQEHPDWSIAEVNREIARRISHGVVSYDSK